MNHPSDDQIRQYIHLESLDTHVEDEMNEHLITCKQCQERSEQLKANANQPGPVSSGDVLDNRFIVKELHGTGGYGFVYEAYDQQIERNVAIKCPRRDAEQDASFISEGILTGQLEHPGIAPVYVVSRSGDPPYYAMKLVTGASLEDRIKSFHSKSSDFGSVAFRRLLGHFDAVCNTIEFVHSRGYTHGDIKPSNIRIGELGDTIVVDWGSANSSEEDLSKHRRIACTPGYARRIVESNRPHLTP